MALPVYATPLDHLVYYGVRVFVGFVFVFLMAPILVIIPLSFNALPYFTFNEAMVSLDPEAFSLRWYRDMFDNEQWIHSIKNSFIIGISATLLATFLGTLAALGLSRAHMPYRMLIMSILISPMIVPIIITAAGMFFFYSWVGLAQTTIGIILAHTALGTPFVVITVTATLIGFDTTLIRASANLGANATTTFFRVIVPMILPGVVSGGLFAFVISFDEVVCVIFLAGFDQRTIPRQMWAGIREQISPTILAVATLLIIFSVGLMFVLELLRRRNERLRGIQSS